MTTKELIDQYVTAHADNRWMDASELETLLTEFAEELKEPASKLTWEDIRCIVKIADQIVDEDRRKFMTMEDEDYCKEVLERYLSNRRNLNT